MSTASVCCVCSVVNGRCNWLLLKCCLQEELPEDSVLFIAKMERLRGFLCNPFSCRRILDLMKMQRKCDVVNIDIQWQIEAPLGKYEAKNIWLSQEKIMVTNSGKYLYLLSIRVFFFFFFF